MRHPRLLALSLLVAACGSPTSTEVAHVTLGGDTVARVGSVTLPVSLVAEVAAASRVEPRVALDRLIADALAAEAARAVEADRAPRAQWAAESILARVTIDAIARAARASGPPTDPEVAEASDAHFRELALPEQIKVIHAVVVHPKSPADAERARAYAAQIAAAVAGAKDADDFEARANAVPGSGLELHVERLPAFIADGRVAEGAPNAFDAAFTAGAFALARPGDTSGVVESAFGWHVIRLLERRPPHVLPLEERRDLLSREIMERRSHAALESTLASARSHTKAEILPAAEALMSSISFDSPP